VAAVVAILVSGTTLFDWFADKASDPPTVKPANIGARIEAADLQLPSERLGDYMDGIRESTDGMSEEALDQRGMVWTIGVRLRGAEGKRIWLQWELLDAVSGEHLLVDTPSWFVPKNQNHWGEAQVWVPYPPSTGSHQVRFSLLNSDYLPLTSVVRDVQPRPAGAR
jgi:hypothetical protein